jgi:catechol-2,3-dioxygenase
MVDETSEWSLRSVLISVSDLDRSLAFYQDLLNCQQVHRDVDVAVLGSDVAGSLMFILRQASRAAVHPGQQTVGLRTFSCDVGSPAELDRVEARLRDLGTFRDRQMTGGNVKFDVLRGYDPDRLPMTFVTFPKGIHISTEDYLPSITRTMYGVDL